MLNRLAQAAIGLSLVGLPSFAALVNFDGIGNPQGAAAYGANVADPSFDDPLAVLGVRISGDTNISVLQTAIGGSIVPDTGIYLQVNTVGNDGLNPSVVTIDFDRDNDNGTWAVGNSIFVDLQDTEMHVALGAYDQAGNLIGSVIIFSSLSGTVDFGTLLGLTALDRVDVIRITDQGGDGYFLDNLAFELDAVDTPEPSTFVLMGIGLAAAGLLRRRR